MSDRRIISSPVFVRAINFFCFLSDLVEIFRDWQFCAEILRELIPISVSGPFVNYFSFGRDWMTTNFFLSFP
jgi:hypothetical protein